MSRPDDRTLDEVYADDTAMLWNRIGKCRRYDLHDWKEACRFQRTAIDIAFKRMGVENYFQLKQKRLDEIFETNSIRVENRTYANQELWKRGIYIYRKDKDGAHGDLAYFVSDKFTNYENPELYSKSRLYLPRPASRGNTSKYWVMTNVPMDDFNRHFLVPLIGGKS